MQAEVQQQRAKEKKIMIKDVEKFRKTGVASDALQADFGLESKVGVEKVGKPGLSFLLSCFYISF